MNWVALTYQNLKLKRSTRFLLLFSICTLAIGGVVWACSFEDESSNSLFSPEAFVAKQYKPFFYDSMYWYYGTNVETNDNNNRFNEDVVNDWDGYLNHNLSKPVLRYLLLHSTKGGVDSVSKYINGKLTTLKPDSLKINVGQLDKNKANAMFSYLKLARDCEKFAVAEDRGWYSEPKPAAAVQPGLEKALNSSLTNSKDAFVGERIWFQLERYYFFNDDTAKEVRKSVKSESRKEATTEASSKNNLGNGVGNLPLVNGNAKILVLFNKYQSIYPKNQVYYRTLGYVAGYYRRKGAYALANYLYSRCYDFSFAMKIPSKFSFRVLQDGDWQETLKLAKNKEEKITLWHMLGMEYDAPRAIKEIAALDPKSDKLDLLLSRLVNSRENQDNRGYFITREFTDLPKNEIDKIELREIRLVDSIALKNNTAKPYYWNIAAGYLHYINNDYTLAARFYTAAQKQLPANDKLIMAQYKMLSILLDVARLKRIDAKTEAKLVAPLNWLQDLQEGKEHFDHLRIGGCADVLAKIYLKQKDSLKANCFLDSTHYGDSAKVQQMVDFLNKPNKTAFEKVMARYYPHKLDELYYHQAIKQAYQDEIDKAVLLMSKVSTMQGDTLYGNPFNSRLNDCHDCDHAAPQKQKFTPLSFLKTIQAIKAEIKAGNNLFRNNYLLADAYYNMSYFGNARFFYEKDIFGGIENADQDNAEKYYLLARKNAQTDEQRAKCTFMASKCEHNKYYTANRVMNRGYSDSVIMPPPGKYFEELKAKYARTRYYQEVLKECGYFKDFVTAKN